MATAKKTETKAAEKKAEVKTEAKVEAKAEPVEVRPDLLLIEIEQSLKKLSPIFQSYEKSIRDGKLVDNNPVSLWCALNTQVKPDINNNYKPMKKNHSSQQKIEHFV